MCHTNQISWQFFTFAFKRRRQWTGKKAYLKRTAPGDNVFPFIFSWSLQIQCGCSGGSLRFWTGGQLSLTPGQRIGKAIRALPPRGSGEFWNSIVAGMCFLHFEAADNDFQQPKKDNFSRQFNHDLIPIPTTQIGLFGSLLIALLIIIFTQTHCQHLSRNQLIFKISMTRREEHCFNVNAPKIISLA